MATGIENVDFFDLDAHWDNTIDDVTLSQISTTIENEHVALERLEDFSLSQILDKYEVDMEIDQKELDNVDFQLTEEPLTADNVINEMEKAVAGSNASSRYNFTDDSMIEKLVHNTESKNTRRNTNWSVPTFNDWKAERMMHTDCSIPELEKFSVSDVNQWLSKFAVETRRKDGKPYPPKTLYMLCVGLLRHLRENDNHINFLDEKDSKFYQFRRALSARMTELTAQGVGTTVKQAEPLSRETEEILWQKGLLGNSSAKAMLNTVFFYNSKLFGLRGVDEHRNLSVEQFEIGTDQNGSYILFTGRANKTYKGKTI